MGTDFANDYPNGAMKKTNYYLINGITLYRLVAAPVLLYFVITKQVDIFKWLLAVSFFTDAIDGFLARKYKVVSVLGARLDSWGDDLTVIVGVIGLFVLRPEFIRSEYIWLIVLLFIFLVQVTAALIRYKSTTSFHTYLAKLAAILQGSFLILAFFMLEPNRTLFYVAMIVTALDLIEEIILVFLLPRPKSDVKGVYWALQQKSYSWLVTLSVLALT
jgi:phosphatidylglycerophosphate synthase